MPQGFDHSPEMDHVEVAKSVKPKDSTVFGRLNNFVFAEGEIVTLQERLKGSGVGPFQAGTAKFPSTK